MSLPKLRVGLCVVTETRWILGESSEGLCVPSVSIDGGESWTAAVDKIADRIGGLKIASIRNFGLETRDGVAWVLFAPNEWTRSADPRPGYRWIERRPEESLSAFLLF